jgi:hypothetical protein
MKQRQALAARRGRARGKLLDGVVSREITVLLAAGAIRNLGFAFYNIVFTIYLSK